MRKLGITIAASLCCAFAAGCGESEVQAAPLQVPALAPDGSPFRVAARIVLPKVEGRLDHIAWDSKRDRAWIAARANGSVEIVDLAEGKHVLSRAGFVEAQGIAYLPETDRVVVACGDPGALEVFDAQSGDSAASIGVGLDADVVRYDATLQRVFVGWGSGAIAVVDTKAWKVVSAFSLTSHPEGFALTKDGERLIVNLAEERKIVEISRAEKTLKAAWSLGERRGNYPMVLVENDTRVVIGVRDPPSLVTLDAKTGAVLASEPMSADVDDLFEDVAKQRIYAACGEGWIDVFERKSDGAFRRIARHATRKGARTALFVPEKRRLLLAVPAGEGKTAELWVLDVAE